MALQSQTRSTQSSAAQPSRPRDLTSSGKLIALPRGSRKWQYVTRSTGTCSKFKRCAHSMEESFMKKLALAVLLVALVGTLAMAQGYTGTATGPDRKSVVKGK